MDQFNFNTDPDPNPGIQSRIRIRPQQRLNNFFYNSSDLGFESKPFFFLQFLYNILSLGSGSVDPHIIADSELESQNVADMNPNH